MEEDGIQGQACKFPRIENGTARNDSFNNTKIGSSIKEENGDLLRKRSGGGGGGDGTNHRFHSWNHHSSRIIRVSRASGGKDRHSKVMTSKGLRDRRVRLSVTTAIQFYDLQDRLGYDQPSKAVEWLIKAASDAISELPSLSNTFPETPKQPSDEKRGGDKCGIGSADAEEDGEASFHHHHQNQSQNLSLSKSACSSTSETSKGSGGLSLSRSEIRVKARERARERAAKEKEKENDESCNNNNNFAHHPHNNNNNIVISMAQTSSFTELLTGVPAVTTNPTGSGHHHHHHRSDEADLFNKGARHQWNIAPMDYFGAGILGGSSSTSPSRTGQHHHQSSGFSGQIQLGNNLAQAMSVAPPFGVQSENQHSDQLQHFSFFTDHLMPAGVVTSSSPVSQAPSGGGGGSGENNLNFTISSSSHSGGLAGFNSRGTLQSNSPSLLPHHLQRFSPLDGSSNLPFFIGTAPAPAMENHHHHQHQHHQFSPELDGRLQLCYGDGSRHSDQKGKGKN